MKNKPSAKLWMDNYDVYLNDYLLNAIKVIITLPNPNSDYQEIFIKYYTNMRSKDINYIDKDDLPIMIQCRLVKKVL